MMTINDIEEAMSRAYVFAVAGRAGVDISGSFKDYGVDGTFRPITLFEGQRFPNGHPIDFQLKASIGCTFESDSIVYDMEASAHKMLVYRRNNGSCPHILILMALPRDQAEWLSHTEDALLLRKCCYWYQVGTEYSANTKSVRIRVPRSQQFTPDSLSMLLDLAASGGLQ